MRELTVIRAGRQPHQSLEDVPYVFAVHPPCFVTQRTLLVTQDGQPFELHMKGYDFAFDSHPDIYIFNVTRYFPNFNQPGVFDAPALCDSAPTNAGLAYRTTVQLGQLSVFNSPKRPAKARGSSRASALL